MTKYSISLSIKGIFDVHWCVDDGTGDINARFNIIAENEADLKEKLLELIDNHIYYNQRSDIEIVFCNPLISNTFKKLKLF